MRHILLEALLVAVVGAFLAFAANALSPRGLKLSRNFFPPAPSPATGGSLADGLKPVASSTNSLSATESLVIRLRQQGLQLINSNKVAELFRDPRIEQGLVIFIDARDEAHYQSGHVPGAHEFDYYHAENYLATVLPACQGAQEIVVYCDGGTCEDSELAATFLLSANVPKEKLLVYGGGFSEWTNNRMPIEIGPRKSSQMRQAK